MSDLLITLGWVFGTVAVVFSSARAWPGLQQFSGTVQRVAFDALMPVLLFHMMARTEVPSLSPWLIAAYYLPTLLLYAAAVGISGRTQLARGNIHGLTVTYSNAVLLGIPLAVGTLPPASTIQYFALVALHTPILFLVTSLLDGAARASGADVLKQTGLRLIKNPILIGMSLGVASRFSPVAIPSALFSVTEVISQLAGPTALAAMGLGLASYTLRTTSGTALRLSATKLLLHPIAVAVALWLLPLPATSLAPALLLASLPVGVNVYLFAVRFEQDAADVAATILLTTLLCPISIAILLTLIR